MSNSANEKDSAQLLPLERTRKTTVGRKMTDSRRISECTRGSLYTTTERSAISEKSSAPSSPFITSSRSPTPPPVAPAVFERETTKFWVLPSNCVEVKRTIMKYLPEWRFDGKVSPSIAESGSWVSSIYFDNANWELYRTRLLRSDSSMLFRWRWYSKMSPVTIGFMEQKVRRPRWRGEFSVKKRFELRRSMCMDYLHRGNACFEDEYLQDEEKDLAVEMYEDIWNWGLGFHPKVRTTYRRTVFQQYLEAPVRASFDEDMILSTVKSFDQGVDLDVDDPSGDSFVFPIGVLEVKLAFNSKTRRRNEVLILPDWCLSLIKRGIITEVPKFSKYITAVACLHLGEIDHVPSWLQDTQELIGIEITKRGMEIMGSLKPSKLVIPDLMEIEPRIFMANERTYLKWARVCFIVLFLGMGMVGTGIEPTLGLVMIICSFIILLRAHYTFKLRMKMIKDDDFYRYPFYDRYNPHFLMILFVVPAVVMIIKNGIHIAGLY
jgi:uncharacterized membrane protein YidH (DUF202 family)